MFRLIGEARTSRSCETELLLLIPNELGELPSYSWIGMYFTSTSSNTEYIDYKWVTGKGNRHLIKWQTPAYVGSYDFRFFINNEFKCKSSPMKCGPQVELSFMLEDSKMQLLQPSQKKIIVMWEQIFDWVDILGFLGLYHLKINKTNQVLNDVTINNLMGEEEQEEEEEEDTEEEKELYWKLVNQRKGFVEFIVPPKAGDYIVKLVVDDCVISQLGPLSIAIVDPPKHPR